MPSQPKSTSKKLSASTPEQERNSMLAARDIGIEMCIAIAGLHASVGSTAREVYDALIVAKEQQKRFDDAS